jgi:hypothetical protein
MPELGHGETAEKPMPAPNASSTNVKAAAVTPPAITAAQEAADGSFTATLDPTSVLSASVIANALQRIVCNREQPRGWMKVPTQPQCSARALASGNVPGIRAQRPQPHPREHRKRLLPRSSSQTRHVALEGAISSRKLTSAGPAWLAPANGEPRLFAPFSSRGSTKNTLFAWRG